MAVNVLVAVGGVPVTVASGVPVEVGIIVGVLVEIDEQSPHSASQNPLGVYVPHPAGVPCGQSFGMLVLVSVGGIKVAVLVACASTPSEGSTILATSKKQKAIHFIERISYAFLIKPKNKAMAEKATIVPTT